MEGDVERSEREDPGVGGVALLAFGVAGFTMCLTLLYHGMRAVMDIGGFCAEGGAYVIQHPCPEGAVPATLLGSFGMLLFGAIAMVGALKVGGYGWLLIAGWTALFATLGWNFLDYGVVNPPDGEVQWGWLIPGVLFELMAWVPAVFVIKAALNQRRVGGSGPAPGIPGPSELRTMPGPSQPAPDAHEGVAVAGPPDTDTAEQAARHGIAVAMGAVIADAVATTPADPLQRELPGDAPGEPAEDFSEGTQALLDRLERLADMRDRGLLEPGEYETAKEAIVRELETRQ
jgi:hypothetical protein